MRRIRWRWLEIYIYGIGSKMKKARKNNNNKKKPFQIGGLDMWNDIICLYWRIALDIELLKLNFKCKQEVLRTFYM